MRTFSFLLLLVLPFSALAEGSPILDRALDSAIGVVDTVFSKAQETVQRVPLDEQTATSVSNVLKTKHDTVKNSISNIR